MSVELLLAVVAVLVALGALVMSVRPRDTAFPTEDITPRDAPRECADRNHDWPDRPYLIDGRTHLYLCRRGCGSQLRHRLPKEK